MPYVLRPRGLRATLTALVAAVAALAVPAAASAACPTAPTTKAFQAFGDSSDYALVPGGAFETGAPGWGLNGASVANGSESYAVHSPSDSKSLAIAPGGVAVSPTVCVDLDHPTFRFFAKRTSGSWGVLTVKLRWKDDNGNVNETTVGALSSGTDWQPSAAYNLSRILPIWNDDQMIPVQLVFDPENAGGAFAIDDVYVDPYARG
jgi:hypothetical protein